ncbi:hypothetical protein A2971_05285 [Candidatus Gottesmanbacteria bacterium RIFCSPLOWO2_01_FULL_46_21]|uniref:Uncharacterized protein n=2 Tax=Candidatus Gottesmaniibacteriota TaxID=1752720 RepID=A0A0G1TH60_9BACT|nr:MAG: hypothetical protein UY08_C0002G0022 [Candidatus Gottesmanbacteria bacterium GW2011_GWA1_47_8]OGG28784.1 MAG: hypothetical protein A2971_05285 [Candidatus Gottesmanbacteria bacterium RIFCSPLOWO2_01_FULL_46_21]
MSYHGRLNIAQLDRLSEIIGNLGLLFLATLVLPIFVKGSIVDPITILVGVIVSIVCVIVSMFLLRKNT